MKTKIILALAAATLFASHAAQADRVLSDFNNTGFSSVGSGDTETVGSTYDTLSKPNGTNDAISGDLNYDPNGTDLTGLTGFNVTYTLTLDATSSPMIFLGFFVRDLDHNQAAGFIQVSASSSFVTSFVPVDTSGIDPSMVRFVRFSSSDFNSNGAFTYQIDNITAVGVAPAPEPSAGMLLVAGATFLGTSWLFRRLRPARHA